MKNSKKIVKALAGCVETLCIFALADTMGSIREALAADNRIWDYLNPETIEVLENACGFTRPTIQPA